MRILILSGSHPRHLFVHKALLECGIDCSAVIMERESLIPSLPHGVNSRDARLFNQHFQTRYEKEEAAFGHLTVQQEFGSIPIYYCTPQDLNSKGTVDFVKAQNADMAFIFGTDLIKGELLAALPEDKINLHLGLSPWYRGSATLFWPFYFLQPQFAGATFHRIVPEADGGAILHQVVPELRSGDGIHDVGVRTVISARHDLIQLINQYKRNGKFEYYEQKSSGRLFLTRDFHISHLRMIYDLYENKIVDRYLEGELNQVKPKLITYK